MRQQHRAGEKLFIDYCGSTVDIVDCSTGEVRSAKNFVTVPGASSYTYDEATWTQTLPDWIDYRQRAQRFYGSVPELLVPDNLKSAVNRASCYAPQVNATNAEMAAHYQISVLPERTYRPRDKAKTDVGMQLVERWILAVFRHHSFFSLAAFNRASADLLLGLNENAPSRDVRSRWDLFDSIDRAALKPLPQDDYVYAEWRKAKPGVDYHVEMDKRFYSVPMPWSATPWIYVSPQPR